MYDEAMVAIPPYSFRLRPRLGFWRHDLLQRRDERCKISSRHLPDDILIDIEVVMDDLVTHADHPGPWDTPVKALTIRRDPPSRLSDRLDQVSKRETQVLVSIVVGTL